MIAEEDSQFLRKSSSKLYLEKVVYYVNQILSPKTCIFQLYFTI